ncbi:MAG: aldo/keto reductase [Armatimonadota bacterium]
MKYRKLGRTNLNVSEISLGAWSLGGIVRVRNRTSANADPCGYGEVSEVDGIAIVKHALTLGINFIDTAPMYGDGHSELRVQKALQASGRTDIMLCTKCGVFAEDGEYVRRFTRDVVLREVEKSLKRLGRDSVDIELLHSPTIAEYGDGDCWKALLELKQQGVVRWVGISINSELDQAREFVESGLCDVMMLKLNMLDTAMLPVCELAQKNNVGIMIREAFAGGFLTGAFNENTVFTPDDQRAMMSREYVLSLLRKVEKLKPLANDRRSLAQTALLWLLSLPGVSTVTVGTSSKQRLTENSAVSDMPPLTTRELGHIDEILSIL